MRFITIVLAALAAFAFSGQVMARSAPLVDPDPIEIPAGLTDKQIAKEIKRALLQRGWEVTSDKPGDIEGTLHLRTHMAKIRITYDSRQVNIAYLDSSELEYAQKNGKRVIHPNYLGWIGFLASDIKANLAVTALDSDTENESEG